MSIEVLFFESSDCANALARQFLIDEPVFNNLVLTLLSARVANPQPGRYWVARLGGKVLGVALQSPHSYPINLSTMTVDVAAMLANEIASGNFALPGVSGEARIAARFAGQWTERRKIAAFPSDGQRVYEASAILEGTPTSGFFRRAQEGDQRNLRDWVSAFQAETGGGGGNAAAFVRNRVSAGEIWLWDDDGACCMAAATAPVAGVTRIQYVYTPPERRCKGYAESLVRNLTRQMLSVGLRPILFTELSNPTSNAVYRRIGYQAMTENISYIFGCRSIDGS